MPVSSALTASAREKPRIAIVRGPNLNPWEAQMFGLLQDRFDITGVGCRQANFELSGIPFPVVRLPSLGQAVRSRRIRSAMDMLRGDHHDLRGLPRALSGFDIVHAAESYYYFTAQAARLRRRLGFRLVVTVWENIPFQLDHPSTRRIKQEVFHEADLFLPVTSRARDVLLLEGAPPERTHILMPGIDVEHFAPAPRTPDLLRQFGCDPDDFIVMYVAHLSRQKGVYDLCTAARLLLTSNPGIPLRLLIAGKGPEEQPLREYIRRIGIETHVRLIGPHPYASMPAIHNLADVFVLPSQPTPTWQEQFGYVLVESMACGKTVVGAMTGSIPEVIGDAGVSIPPSDVRALADALAHLAADPGRRRALGTRARARAVELFDRRKAALHIRSYYEALLHGVSH